MQQVLRTKGRGDRVYTVFQLPDHQGSKSRSGGVPRVALGGNRVSASPSFTFFTYSLVFPREEPRWRDDGCRDTFFATMENVRKAVAAVRDEVSHERDQDVPSMHIERIETVPLTMDAVLALLNEGVGAIVKRYDVIETVEGAGAHGENT